MDFVERLKSLLTAKSVEPDHTELVFVYLPELLDPMERHERYAEPLDAELRLRGFGYVSGGGSMLSEENPDGTHDIEWSGIDVDASDTPAARELLRKHLPPLGCMPGTQLQYRQGGRSLYDEYDGETWITGASSDGGD